MTGNVTGDVDGAGQPGNVGWVMFDIDAEDAGVTAQPLRTDAQSVGFL